MRNLMRLLVSRAMRNDTNVPHICFADRFQVPEYDICDCIDKCKYDSPNFKVVMSSWVNTLPFKN